MIRHYDMATGEPLESTTAPAAPDPQASAHPIAEARLMTVQEAAELEAAARPTMPLDLLTRGLIPRLPD